MSLHDRQSVDVSDTDETGPADSPLEKALVRMAGNGPILEHGYFDHGPMAAEALEAMNLPGRIAPFVQRHVEAGGVRAAPGPAAPIRPRSWSGALGRPARYADWVALIDAEMANLEWRALARRWIVRLTPGAATAAVHGLIRTAHAVRALERCDSPARRAELVRALASWASLYTPPPWAPITARGRLSAQAAFDALAPAPIDLQAREGSISAGLAKALNAPGFADQVAAVDTGGAVDARADDVLQVFTSAFLDHARSPYTAIVWCHAITGAMSLRRLLGVMSEDEARALLTRLFEIGCAMKAAFDGLHATLDPGADMLDTPGRLAQRAADSGDDHAIKLTDALLQAHHSSRCDDALRAADRGIRLLGA